jgi:CDP-paratose 2-epimerase
MRGRLTPLHASKASAENYVKIYADTYNLRAAVFGSAGFMDRDNCGEDHGWVANFSIRNLLRRPLMIYGWANRFAILFMQQMLLGLLPSHRQGEVALQHRRRSDARYFIARMYSLIEHNTGIASDVKFALARMGDLNYFVCDTKKAAGRIRMAGRSAAREGPSDPMDPRQPCAFFTLNAS